MKKLLIIMMSIYSTSVFATSEIYQNLCIKYQKTYGGWSNPYSVKARLLNGSDLNQLTHSANYISQDKYAIIYWKRSGSITIIKRYNNSLLISKYNEDGIDNKGKHWKMRGNINGGYCR